MFKWSNLYIGLLVAYILVASSVVILQIPSSFASGGRINKIGHVLTRGLVRGPSGQPIFAEFDEKGIAKAISGLPNGGEATGDLKDAQVISGAAYRLLAKAYNDFKIEYAGGIARGATVMTKDAYEAYQNNPETIQVPQPDNRATLTLTIPKPALRDGTRSVLVRNHNTIVDPRFLPIYGPQRGTILFEAPISLRAGELIEELPESIQSVLNYLTI